MGRTMSDKELANRVIDEAERRHQELQAKIATYASIFERYDKVDDVRGAVLMSTRLLIHRRGYSQVLRNLQLRGVDWMMQQALAEMNATYEFVMELLAMASDTDATVEEKRETGENVAGLLADMNSPDGLKFLRKLMERLRTRADWWFASIIEPAKVH